MEQRQAYERAVISSFARLAGRRAPGIADEERDSEYRAQQIFYAALAPFRTLVADAAALTVARADALHDLLAGLTDATPDRKAWDEAIAEARRGD